MVVMKSFQIEYDEMPPKELRGNSRTQWRGKLKPKRRLQDTTIAKLREIDPGYMGKVKIKYTAYYSGLPIDIDNLITGMKYAQDCLAIEGIITDDNPEHVVGMEVEYHRVPTKRDIKLIMEVKKVDA